MPDLTPLQRPCFAVRVMSAERDDLESLRKACEEAMAHLGAIIEEANNRFTLLALHVQPDTPRTPSTAEQAASDTPGICSWGSTIGWGGSPRFGIVHGVKRDQDA